MFRSSLPVGKLHLRQCSNSSSENSSVVQLLFAKYKQFVMVSASRSPVFPPHLSYIGLISTALFSVSLHLHLILSLG